MSSIKISLTTLEGRPLFTLIISNLDSSYFKSPPIVPIQILPLLSFSILLIQAIQGLKSESEDKSYDLKILPLKTVNPPPIVTGPPAFG